MGNTVRARLDERSRKRLKALVQELEWSPSRVVREGFGYLKRVICGKENMG
jgi:hypothetical protein